MFLVADAREEEVRAQLLRPAFHGVGKLPVRFLAYGALEQHANPWLGSARVSSPGGGGSCAELGDGWLSPAALTGRVHPLPSYRVGSAERLRVLQNSL